MEWRWAWALSSRLRNDIGRRRGADEYGDEDDEANGEDWEHDGDFTDDDEAAGVGDQGRLDDENPVDSKSWREGTRINDALVLAPACSFLSANDPQTIASRPPLVTDERRRAQCGRRWRRKRARARKTTSRARTSPSQAWS